MATPPSNKNRRIKKINAFTQARLIKLLLEGTYNCQELAEETGLHYVTVLEYTRELHHAGAVHISSWDKDARGRDVVKIYKLGVGKDAKRQKLSAAERQEAVRTKRRAAEQALALAGKGSFEKQANGRYRFVPQPSLSASSSTLGL